MTATNASTAKMVPDQAATQAELQRLENSIYEAETIEADFSLLFSGLESFCN